MIKFKRTLWTEIKYYGFYCWWNYLDMLPRRIYWFFQRGFRGYGDNDIWDFDIYLSKIISGGLKQLNKYNHGIPIDIHDKYKKNDEKASQEWIKIIDKMIGSFKIHIKLLNEHTILKGKDKKHYEEGFKLFVKYFGDLWD